MDDPFISDFASAYVEEYGSFAPIYGKSVGDFNAFGRRMPTVVYGPKGENWHGADENVDIGSVKRVAGFYADLLKRMGEKYEREQP